MRANTTRAVDAGDGSYLLTGHKWFCSAPMSDAFLVLAQTRCGLGCFLVPRVLDDGTRNVFLIQRLKDKLGNRSNASGEIEFDRTVGFLLGEEGRGVRTIIEMVNRTRLDCILGTSGGHAPGGRRGALACAAPSRVRRPAGRPAGDDRGGRRPRARVGGRDRGLAAPGPRPRRRRLRHGPRLPPARHGGHEVLGLQARARSRVRGAGMPRRQRLHRGVPAGAPLPRAAGDGGLGGLGQRDRARRAARDHPRAGDARRLRRRSLVGPRGSPGLRRAPRVDADDSRGRWPASDSAPRGRPAAWWARSRSACRPPCCCARRRTRSRDAFVVGPPR